MPAEVVATPQLLTGPGYLFIAPLATAIPANTVVGGVFTDAWPAAWLRLGATEDGTEESYTTNVEAIEVAEFFDPVRYETTGREGSIAFALASYTLSNYRRALNGGVAALTATSGTGGTSLFTLSPPTPGAEVRSMIGWESLDSTLRFVAFQCIQGGEITSNYKKAPEIATIACTFNYEVNSTGIPWTRYAAGTGRG